MCDTLVALGNSTKSGNLIFAKNSDRPLGEAQPLQIYEAKDYPEDSLLKCTYITIPQAGHTYKVMGSRPFWMWGFEFGMNEHGVVIGNEAVYSREPEEEKEGLLGMDLLRLGLERGRTAYESLHVITDLLEKYGQGGNCALHTPMHYHNAFLIADIKEAWIVDTCNRRWVARRVKDIAGISNCYSTGTDWDEDSGDIREYAYKMGWADEKEPFHFSKVYGQINMSARSAYPRYSRMNQMLKRNRGSISIDIVKNIMRDHYEGEVIEPRWSPADGVMASVCLHNIDCGSSKTAAGIVVEQTPGEQTVCWACMSNPCLSVYLPYTINSRIPKEVSYAGEFYEDHSLWWKMERLAYEIEVDYPRNIQLWNLERNGLEESIRKAMRNGITDTLAETFAIKLGELADKMYIRLKEVNATTGEPQRLLCVKTAKERAKIC